MNIKILTKKYRFIPIICALLCSAILFACFYAPDDSGIVVLPGALADSLRAEGRDITETTYAQRPSYSDSASALMMSAAYAYPFVQSRGGKYTTYYLSTIVIAIDRAQTEALPDSWEALLHCNEKVAFSSHDMDMLGASLIHALGGENAALRFLYTLQKQDRLIYQRMDNTAELFEEAPIAILTDDKAAYLLKQGYKLNVIVPTEGTLTMPWGLYEKSPEITLSKDTLINAGLRLPDGTCDPALYQGNYSSAHIIDDYQSYGQTANNFFPRFRREVLNIRLYTTANGFEHLLSYLLFAVGICVWAFLLYMRIAKRRLQKILILQAALLLFWMLIRYLKLVMYSNVFLLWYCYYLPILFSPLLFVYACRMSMENSHGKRARRINIAFVVVTALLFLLVFTNNLHQFVFHFTENSVMNWVEDYTYNFGYFIMIGWIGFLLVYGFFLLFRRVGYEDSTHIILAPIIALGILLSYCIAYVCNLQIAIESEISFIVSAFILILWELCLDMRLFQSNTSYTNMFVHVKIPIWILNSELQVKRLSAIAGALPVNVTKAIREGTTFLLVSRSEVCNIMKIHGGYSVWKKDISRILLFQEQLRDKAKETEEQNLILQKEVNLRKETAILEHRKNAIAKIEAAISDKLKEIRSLSEKLTPNADINNRNILIRIKLLTGFCKRIGMLMLSGELEGYVKIEMLGLLMSEAAIDVKAADITCSVYYEKKGRIPAESAACLYLFFSRCMMSLTQQKEEATVFCRFLLEKSALTLLLIMDVSDETVINSLSAEVDSSDFFKLEIISSREEEGFMIKVKTGGYIDD